MLRCRTGTAASVAPVTCALAVALLALLPTPALAQATGVIEGVVRNTSGEALPGANVIAIRDTVEAGEATDSTGSYSLTVPPGQYDVVAQSDSYQTRKREVVVSSRDTARVDFALKDRDVEITSFSGGSGPAISPSENFNLMGMNYLIGGFSGLDEPQPRPPNNYSNQVKFRVSVRYLTLDLLPGDPQSEDENSEDENSEDERSAPETGLHLTYEQNSFWHLYEKSSPFYDNNYKPGVVLRFNSRDFGISGSYAPALELGLVHESNGRDGKVNRSWNRLTAGVQFGVPGSSQFSVSLTAWSAISKAEQNKDIVEQVGRGEIGLHVAPLAFEEGFLSGGRFGSISAHVNANWGEDVVENVEANLLFQPSFWRVGDYLKPSFIIQYYWGTGENLINYNEKHSSIRVGIAIVR